MKMQATTGGVLELFAAYIESPQDWWAERYKRQIHKVRVRSEFVGKRDAATIRIVAEDIVAAATLRQRTRKPTVFLSNVGSSGSHWLESLLVTSGRMLGAGEVYLSRALKKQLSTMSIREQGIFIDAVHLLHARAVPGGCLDANVINSCHSIGIDHFIRAEADCIRVLLLRDPLDICLSRTFRKDSFRSDRAADASDEAYLETNVEQIEQFFAWACEQEHAVTVRYEDLLRDPRPAVREICAVAGAQLDPGALERAIEDHDAASLLTTGPRPGSNLYRGSRAVPPEVQERVADRFTSLRRRMGYA